MSVCSEAQRVLSVTLGARQRSPLCAALLARSIALRPAILAVLAQVGDEHALDALEELGTDEARETAAKIRRRLGPLRR